MVTIICTIISFFLLFLSCSSEEENQNLFELKWEKVQQNPIIPTGLYEWDNKQVLVSTVMQLKNKFWMWHYSLGDKEKFQIGLKESKNGYQWRNVSTEPILKPGANGEWDDFRVSKPCVIYDGNLFRMWYVGETRIEGRVTPRIGYASSKDGLNWIKSELNPVFDLNTFQYDYTYFLRYFWIIEDNGQYKMWFSSVGQNKYKNVESIGYAESANGIDWEVHSDPVLERDTTSIWEDFYVSNPMVIKKDSVYYMFYGGLGRFGFLFKENIGIARSYDGINWEKYHDNPVLVSTDHSEAWDREFVTQPRVLQVSSETYYLWYVGADEKNTSEEKGLYQVGLAIGKFK